MRDKNSLLFDKNKLYCVGDIVTINPDIAFDSCEIVSSGLFLSDFGRAAGFGGCSYDYENFSAGVHPAQKNFINEKYKIKEYNECRDYYILEEIQYICAINRMDSLFTWSSDMFVESYI